MKDFINCSLSFFEEYAQGSDMVAFRQLPTMWPKKKQVVVFRVTCFCRINSKALVPETTDKNVAIICCDHEAVCIDLDALIHKVCDLPFVHTRVIGCNEMQNTFYK